MWTFYSFTHLSRHSFLQASNALVLAERSEPQASRAQSAADPPPGQPCLLWFLCCFWRTWRIIINLLFTFYSLFPCIQNFMAHMHQSSAGFGMMNCWTILLLLFSLSADSLLIVAGNIMSKKCGKYGGPAHTAAPHLGYVSSSSSFTLPRKYLMFQKAIIWPKSINCQK